MKLCLMILSVPCYMLNGLEHTAILSHLLYYLCQIRSQYGCFESCQLRPRSDFSIECWNCSDSV
jgi:hypothetical protein